MMIVMMGNGDRGSTLPDPVGLLWRESDNHPIVDVCPVCESVRPNVLLESNLHQVFDPCLDGHGAQILAVGSQIILCAGSRQEFDNHWCKNSLSIKYAE
jgi:hypothetical protein